MNWFKNIFVLTSCFATPAFAVLLPVDLNNWQEDPGVASNGTWTVQAGNDAVLQTTNGNPTVFYEDGANSRDVTLTGNIRVTTTSDDDFIGFVLGYQTGELYSSAADFWLIDWKQGNQAGFGTTGLAGLALSHVTNTTNLAADFWGHTGGVDEIARATNLANTGWADNTAYAFDLVFTANLIQVSVNGLLELSVTAAQAGVSEFSDGAFGFYNFSQSNVLYSGVAAQDVPFCELNPQNPSCNANGVPTPAPLALLGFGLLALGYTKRKVR
ncbi:MAG: PEP-CTERM sorting domain-containing protein [Hahellaceae bacterium]|nr:PEP-CTERM sorting domain-containing protein [Hahellaceae bacterium]